MEDEPFPIIDPHHHLYDLEHYRYPWLQDGVQPIACSATIPPSGKATS